MNFREYLMSKKIDPDKFKNGDTETYRTFNMHFSQMHPDSFTAQKLFLLNKIRRKYLLDKEPEEKVTTQPKKVKPRIVPKMKK